MCFHPHLNFKVFYFTLYRNIPVFIIKPTTEEKDSSRGRFEVRRCFGGVFPNVENGESGGPHGSMDRRLGLGRVKLTTSSSSSAKLNVRVGWVGHGLCISALPL